MKINCISCGHNIDIEDETYDTYEGQVKCFACDAILNIKTEECHLKSVTFDKIAPSPSTFARKKRAA